MKPYCCEPPFYPDPGELNQPPPNKKIFSVCGREVEKLGGYLSWTSADAAYKFVSGATVKSFRNSATGWRCAWLKPGLSQLDCSLEGLRASSNHGLSRLQPKKDKGITNIMKEEYRYEAVRPTSSTTVLNHIYILAEPGDLTVALARTRVAGKESGQRVWLVPVRGLAVSCIESEHGRQQNRVTSETPSQGSPKAHLILSSLFLVQEYTNLGAVVFGPSCTATANWQYTATVGKFQSFDVLLVLSLKCAMGHGKISASDGVDLDIIIYTLRFNDRVNGFSIMKQAFQKQGTSDEDSDDEEQDNAVQSELNWDWRPWEQRNSNCGKVKQMMLFVPCASTSSIAKLSDSTKNTRASEEAKYVQDSAKVQLHRAQADMERWQEELEIVGQEFCRAVASIYEQMEKNMQQQFEKIGGTWPKIGEKNVGKGVLNGPSPIRTDYCCQCVDHSDLNLLLSFKMNTNKKNRFGIKYAMVKARVARTPPADQFFLEWQSQQGLQAGVTAATNNWKECAKIDAKNVLSFMVQARVEWAPPAHVNLLSRLEQQRWSAAQPPACFTPGKNLKFRCWEVSKPANDLQARAEKTTSSNLARLWPSSEEHYATKNLKKAPPSIGDGPKMVQARVERASPADVHFLEHLEQYSEQNKGSASPNCLSPKSTDEQKKNNYSGHGGTWSKPESNGRILLTAVRFITANKYGPLRIGPHSFQHAGLVNTKNSNNQQLQVSTKKNQIDDFEPWSKPESNGLLLRT
ncbi:hypothetical protein C8R45DRAFT_937190 [Mycena sanguinolenta]|nr:hypothetical protein C8R45DRAFT_937190 [Mycena sanguinolenta]